MSSPSQLLFLPGALGDTEFWKPLASRLVHPARKIFIEYPGFGAAADPSIRNFDDLVAMVARKIQEPAALIAQSMGGVIATRVALEMPSLITHLILAVTSGGIKTKSLGADDWRSSFAKENPDLPDWFITNDTDLTPYLGSISIPVLLLWGDSDPISPVAVGRHIHDLVSDARLYILAGGYHDLANIHADQLAPLVDEHLNF